MSQLRSESTITRPRRKRGRSYAFIKSIDDRQKEIIRQELLRGHSQKCKYEGYCEYNPSESSAINFRQHMVAIVNKNHQSRN